jgi:hypothetical protein
MGDTFPRKGEGAMPWKECSVMDEKVRFVGRLLDGENMAALGREFAISGKTGTRSSIATERPA